MNKSELLDTIIEFYLSSGDYNGLPIYNIPDYDFRRMKELIEEGQVEAISENDVFNPHIRGFTLNLSVEKQIENAKNIQGHTCFYPTEKALANRKPNYKKPYTDLLESGIPQLHIIFFDIEILERYINNPKYIILDNGYRGTIFLKDEYYSIDSGEEYENIRDYGMAYVQGTKKKRAIGVFAVDLAKLSAKVQMMWKAFELENQNECKVAPGFIKNLIYGEWVTDYWIFHALIEEMIVINKQCLAMEIPKLFHHEYGTDYYSMPEGYRTILLPTMKNYYDFVLVVEKMVIHNISVKAFLKDSFKISSIDRKDENGKDKGSLAMLGEWLHKNIRNTNFDIDDVILKPLRKVRKIRQIPAHELSSNSYDLDVYEKQDDLIKELYEAVSAIRSLFMCHPATRNVEIPEYLLNGRFVVY